MPNAPRCGPAMDSRSCQVTQGVTVMEWLPGEVSHSHHQALSRATSLSALVQHHVSPGCCWQSREGWGCGRTGLCAGSWLAPGCAGPVGAALGAWLRGLHVTHSVSL